MICKAVIGAGFGDEGKGKVVSSLCLHDPNNILVIRFCGGHQAGHKVICNDIEHIFSNFGSGSIQGVPTYWSKYCTIDPTGIRNEYNTLKAKGVIPVLYIDPNCPVTTPYEKEWNRTLDAQSGHGSVGVGVGQTYQREADCYSLTAYDLQYPWVVATKLELLKKYYESVKLSQHLLDWFIEDCEWVLNMRMVQDLVAISCNYSTVIFEGSQGLLLDQNIGFFPHVTRGNTGLKNITEMGFDCQSIYLVTRAYQTRHGNGPMTNEHIPFKVDNPYEHNSSSGFQGKFRTVPLDLDLLKYAINKECLPKNKTILVVTCVDSLKKYIFTINGKPVTLSSEQLFLDAVCSHLGVQDIVVSRSPHTVTIQRGILP